MGVATNKKKSGPAAEGDSTAKEALEPPAGNDAERVDRIRDILFGGQMQEYERRFARLEERLSQASADLRDELTQRMESLEVFIRKELESLAGDLKEEEDTRKEELVKLTKELQSVSRSLEKKLAKLGEGQREGLKELRKQLLDLSKSSSVELQKKHNEVSTLVERELDDVRAQKTDRVALAALFTEMGMRLKEEFQLPDPDKE